MMSNEEKDKPPLWDDIDDNDLEAELQRQLDAIDGTVSEDDENSEASGANHIQLLDQAATATENQDVKQEEAD